MKAKQILVVPLLMTCLGLKGQVPQCYTFDKTPRIKHKAPYFNPTGIHTYFDEDSLKLNVEFYIALGTINEHAYSNMKTNYIEFNLFSIVALFQNNILHNKSNSI